jgi:hypothetical protein
LPPPERDVVAAAAKEFIMRAPREPKTDIVESKVVADQAKR